MARLALLSDKKSHPCTQLRQSFIRQVTPSCLPLSRLPIVVAAVLTCVPLRWALPCALQAIHRFGGYAHVSESLGVASHRRPKAYWKDLDNVVQEILQFVQSSDSSGNTADVVDPGSQRAAVDAAAEEEAGAGGNSESIGDVAGGSGCDASASSSASGLHRAPGSSRGVTDCASASDELCNGEAAADKHTMPQRRRRMPTQRQLIQAGRNDLNYAVQLHGHERVAKRCESNGWGCPHSTSLQLAA